MDVSRERPIVSVAMSSAHKGLLEPAVGQKRLDGHSAQSQTAGNLAATQPLSTEQGSVAILWPRRHMSR